MIKNSGTNAIKRALAPTPDSQDEALLQRRISAPSEREQDGGAEAESESESEGEKRGVERADEDEGTYEDWMKFFVFCLSE